MMDVNKGQRRLVKGGLPVDISKRTNCADKISMQLSILFSFDFFFISGLLITCSFISL